MSAIMITRGATGAWLPLVLALSLAAVLAGCSKNAQRASGEEVREHIRQTEREVVNEELHPEAAHGEHAPANPLATNPDLAIYTAIVFGVLVLILGKFAWRPIAEGLDRRERSIAEQIEAANRTHQEARNLLAQYEQRLGGAHDEIRAMLEQARRDAAHASQELIAKANAEAEAVQQRALKDIETAKGSALKELAETSGRLAVSLAGRIVGSELNPDRHNRLIREALDRLPVGNGNRG